jgi:hypothetical protein
MIRHTTLFLFLLLTTSAFAQIPNASFENWTHTATSGAGGAEGYDQPVSWGTPNAYVSTYDSIYMCTKGTGGASGGGSYYLQLTSKTINALGFPITVPGAAVTGNINIAGTTISVSGGFPFTSRPATLTGYWQYTASGSDQGFIVVYLSKWNMALNRRDTVSFTNYALPTAAVTFWTAFSIPLNYSKGSIPDTAMVLLSSSSLTSAVAGSKLYVDTLAFEGNVPTGVVTVVNDRAATTIYPNPTKDFATIYYYGLFAGQVQVNVTDITGKTVRKFSAKVINGSNNINLDLRGLLKGDYLVNLSDGLGTECKKLVVE